MTKWKKYETTFILDSPLHIGYLPFGGTVFSPTRYYVPGKNFWGAVTKRTTEFLYDDPEGEDYQEIGEFFKNNFCFGYHYILDDSKYYTPSYLDNELTFGKISKRQFESKFIGVRTMTKLREKQAVRGSLHEIEFISHQYKESKSFKKTKIKGFIYWSGKTCINNNNIPMEFQNEKGFIIRKNDEEFSIFEQLTLGGEINYGFGRVKLKEIKLLKGDEIDNNRPFVSAKKSLDAHMEYTDNLHFEGNIELLSGREFSTESHKPGEIISKSVLCFSPGTILSDVGSGKFIVGYNGIYKYLPSK